MTQTGHILPPVGAGFDYDLALRHAPLLRLDAQEPYAPQVYGYSVFHSPTQSPSSKFKIEPKGAITLEYAIWYDWDIQHLYDLEHVWVHLDGSGEIIAVDGSFHGVKSTMKRSRALPELIGSRPVLYAEPGKHALWSDGVAMEKFANGYIKECCGKDAGKDGIHTENPFAQKGLVTEDPLSKRLSMRKMQRDRFVPEFDFARSSDDAGVRLVPWQDLAEWIPQRVAYLKAQLRESVPHLAAIFLDCGDTLIDEATEVKDPVTEVVTTADEIPHAMDSVRALHAVGYPLALVADGPRETFENLLKPREIWPLMQTHAISGDIGELKPSPLMFQAAMDGMGLEDKDRERIVMVGNNLARDIKGANEFGLTSLFVAWSNRRSQDPADASEIPDHIIDTLDALVAKIEEIELALPPVKVGHG